MQLKAMGGILFLRDETRRRKRAENEMRKLGRVSEKLSRRREKNEAAKGLPAHESGVKGQK